MGVLVLPSLDSSLQNSTTTNYFTIFDAAWWEIKTTGQYRVDAEVVVVVEEKWLFYYF